MTDDTRPSYTEVIANEVASTLVGGIITGVFINPGDPDIHIEDGYGFTVRSADGAIRNVFVQMDEENNGPGHLDIQLATLALADAVDSPLNESILEWHCNCSHNYAHSTTTLRCSNCGCSIPNDENRGTSDV